MKKFMMKFLFLIAITANSHAAAPILIQFETSDNSSKALSVVEVLGVAKGTGVLAIMDGKIIIVTNSHNLQGKSSAMISLPTRAVNYYLAEPFDWKREKLGFEGMAKVLYDFPLSDVAILAFPDMPDSAQKALIYGYGLANGVFSAQQKAWIPGRQSLGFGETISAIMQGKNESINVLEGFKSNMVPDTFISGDGEPIFAVPVFAKPGFSGGGFYQNGTLTGLMTKISLAGEPIALATPFSKIGKLLYSPDSREKQISWDNGLMVYEGRDKKITMNPLGNGALGNGGELSVLDDSLSGDSNPNYWRLQVNTFSGNRVITTWDPFVYRPGHFKVNNENVSFIKVKTKSMFKTSEKYSIPSIASYLSSEKKGEQQTLLQNTPQNLALLKEERLKNKPNINFGRLYTHDYSENYYKIYNLRYNNVNGAQPLKPMSKDRWAAPKKHNKWSGPKPLFDMDAKVSVDEEGYFSNIPFSTKVADNTIFDLRVSGELFGVKASAYLKGPTDLSHVSLRLVDRNGEKNIVLKPVEFNSANSLVFKSEDDAYRAIYLYTNSDLSLLARIYIVNENSLIELWAN